MRSTRVFRAVRPYLAAVAVTLMVGVLMAAIYFTALELQWVTFLAGILVAAVLALVSRASHAEWTIARRNAQLARARERVADEASRRGIAEKALAALRVDFDLIRISLPTLFAYVDADLRVRFHNQAFRHWLGADGRQIDGHALRDALPPEHSAEIQPGVDRVLAGKTVRYECQQIGPDGAMHRLLVQYLPHSGTKGEVAGFFVILSELTREQPEGFAGSDATSAAAPGPAAMQTAQALYMDSIADELTGWSNVAERLQAALDRDEFRLLGQTIVPVREGGSPACEIFVRLAEEERNLMPPGAFVPLAERHGLMPSLDRWVVRHVIAWLAARQAADPAWNGPICFINLAASTQRDPEFARFVGSALDAAQLPPAALCFEIAESDALLHLRDAALMAQQLKRSGCRVALSGFGRDRVSFDILKSVPTDYLKIDGNVVLGMLGDKVKHARVQTIARVAQSVGLQTVAEYVENDDILAALCSIHVDYVQGFGISRPEPLERLY